MHTQVQACRDIHGAAMNMAIDETLLMDAIERRTPRPSIRFYEWERRSISIGYFQKTAAAVELAERSGADFDIVRRQTGGGIVLHGNDITFSLVISDVVLRKIAGTGTGVVDSYRPVNQAVLSGIAFLCGAVSELTLEKKAGSARGTKFCFSEPTKHDVVMGGRKIAGGAQRRLEGYVLYQGSILLREEPESVLKEFFKGSSVTMEELKGERLGRENAICSLMKGFDDVFDGVLERRGIPEEILDRAKKLAEEKYSTRAWNYLR